jgi:nucleotide-binding universal stress UspA family protein
MQLSSILIAIDSISGSQPVVQAAAELAYSSSAELTAIFIEDDDWFKASRLSFSYQISSFSGELIPFDEMQMLEQAKAHSSLLERMVVKYSSKMNIKYKYHSARGSVIRELMGATEGKDLIIIGRNRQPDGSRAKIGKIARLLAENCTIPVLIWNSRSDWPGRITGIVKTTGSGEKEKVMEWTSGLARLLKRKAEIIPTGKSDDLHQDFDGINPEQLGRDKNRLLIMERIRDKKGLSDVDLTGFPNSVLLL